MPNLFIDRWMAKLPPTARQWVWFALLWSFGLGSVMLLGMAIRLMMGL